MKRTSRKRKSNKASCRDRCRRVKRPEADKRRREMTSFEAVSKCVASRLEDERALEKCLTILRDVIPFENCALFVLTEKTGKLELETALGFPQDLIESVKFDLGHGLSAWAARERKSVLVKELSRPLKEGSERLGSFLAVPIVAGERSIGVITMGHQQSGTFKADHKRILQFFCTLISGFVLSTIENKEKTAVVVM